MERRKFILGVGSAGIGASALIGSGAFTRIESQRAVTIEVAEDPDAYLGLDGCPDSPNSSYTNIDGSGHLEIDMSPDNETDAGGSGINSDSFTYFDDVFQICNQGKQDVCVWIDADVDADLELDEEYDDEDIVDFYVGEDREHSLLGEENGVLLPVGECLCVGIATVTKGLEEGDQLLEGDEIVINADADAECDNGLVDNGRTAISFAAFCVEDNGDVPIAEDITISDIMYKTNGELEPVGFTWESDKPLDRVVLKGGQEWYVYEYEGATSGQVEMEGVDEGMKDGMSPSTPCGDGYTGVKFEWDGEEFVPEENND